MTTLRPMTIDGYLQHLAVRASHRRRGIANSLVDRCLAELASIGIVKSHVDVFRTNEIGNAYWARQGWKLLDDTFRFSYVVGGNPNA